MNINNKLRGRVLIKNKLVFGGGQPKFRYTPVFVRWGKNISLFWLGVELVWLK